MSNVEPCPFCGKIPTLECNSYNDDHLVQCCTKECILFGGRQKRYGSFSEAIAEWNKRVNQNETDVEFDRYLHFAYCQHCGETIEIEKDELFIYDNPYPNYCPYCGYKIKKPNWKEIKYR